MPKSRFIIPQNLDLDQDQIALLEVLGDLEYYTDLPASPDEWLKRCMGADIICTNRFGFNTVLLYELQNVFFSLPFVGIEFLDIDKLKERNISVSNSPGCNKEAVAEWMISLMLLHFRKLKVLVNADELSKKEAYKITTSLYGKKVAILGKGNVGSEFGKLCSSFRMDVVYFTRGDNLYEIVKEADIIANCLGVNETTKGLLNIKFFNFLKKGSFFISVTSPVVYDLEALFSALDNNILAGAIDDAGGSDVANTNDPIYQKLKQHPKILATPHISWNTDFTVRKSNDIMIENIVQWLAGTPQNLVTR